jgi:hypothetical protein
MFGAGSGAGPLLPVEAACADLVVTTVVTTYETGVTCVSRVWFARAGGFALRFLLMRAGVLVWARAAMAGRGETSDGLSADRGPSTSGDAILPLDPTSRRTASAPTVRTAMATAASAPLRWRRSRWPRPRLAHHRRERCLSRAPRTFNDSSETMYQSTRHTYPATVAKKALLISATRDVPPTTQTIAAHLQAFACPLPRPRSLVVMGGSQSYSMMIDESVKT